MSTRSRAARPSADDWTAPRPAPTKTKRKPPAKGEETQQRNLMTWAKWARLPDAPDIEPAAKVADYLFAIPNGGSRNVREAANLKATGVKAGVHDLMLPIARQGFHGLWVEMKFGDGKLTDNQAAWGERMRLAGYKTVTAWTSDEARASICEYLTMTNQ